METALYCPKTGYYERLQEAVGCRGDFVTSVSVGALFGQFLAAQFTAWCEEFSGPVQWVEAGAHDGRLARDILHAVQQGQPALFRRLKYTVVEPSENRCQWQRETLGAFDGHVCWVKSISDLRSDGVNGIIFSNELLDAFPVHRLGWDAGLKTWFEWGVGWGGTRFVWRRMNGAECDWPSVLAGVGFVLPPELCAVIPEGYVIEVSPEAGDWWRNAARALKRGRLTTIDYGQLADQLVSPERREGTLRAYRRQTVSADLLSSPGDQDLTAHVNFTQLMRAGESEGLMTEQFLAQSEFLAHISRRVWGGTSPPSSSEIRQFQALTHPEHLGRAFRVLVQSRQG